MVVLKPTAGNLSRNIEEKVPEIRTLTLEGFNKQMKTFFGPSENS